MAIAALVVGLLVLSAVTGLAVWQGFEWTLARQNAHPKLEVSAHDGPAAMAAAVDFARELTTVDWRIQPARHPCRSRLRPGNPAADGRGSLACC